MDSQKHEHSGVSTNYNAVGTDIFQRLYGQDFLSPGGLQATRQLAEFGRVRKGSRVLDIGCGLGGAAFFLADELNCDVVGLDLMAENVSFAHQRAAERGLSRRRRC